MKRFTLLSILFFSLPAMAQLRVGLHSGMNISLIDFGKGFKDTKPLFRYTGGVLIEFPLDDDWSLLPGLQYSGKGVVFIRSYTTGRIDSFRIKLNYIECPVNIQYRFAAGNTNNVTVAAGPYLGYGFNGEESIRADNRPPLKHLHKKETDHYKRIELGLDLAAGYEFGKKYTLRTGYSRSLLSIHRYEKQRNSVFSVSLVSYLNRRAG